MKSLLVVAVLLSAASLVQADVYMHNPRGSNNRCDEQNNDRNNNNRLMNTQNNAAGGYAVAPPLYYYVGSILSLEWTQQHTCGETGYTDCQIIFQYSCDPTYKDGTSTDPTGDNGGNTCTTEITAANQDQPEVGRHESLAYFTACNNRERNKGLFHAAENVNNGAGAQATRQNQNGGTSGFECQEERDYYPYWHPTPFVDAAILTTNVSRCDYYKANSENVKARNYCSDQTFNNQGACTTGGGTWLESAPNGRPAPDCVLAPFQRDNSLGASSDGYLPQYNWTIPNDVNTNCFLRMRYNISTADYDPWSGIDSGSDGARSPVQDDPYVQFGESYLRLAIDTNQFGRTFEDRSYLFEIRTAPVAGLTGTVYNLNVRGKRGNIAQVRNNVEYDFAPQRLMVGKGDMVHFQWTGSNHNPNGNAGEGRNRWDRSNIVQLARNEMGVSYPMTLEEQTMFDTPELAFQMAFIGQNIATCKSLAALQAANDDNTIDNCAKLNGNPTGYFDAGLVRLNRTGTFLFMSSRNNNFSNRGQKGTLIVGVSSRRVVFLFGALLVGGVVLVAGAGAGMFYLNKNKAGSSPFTARKGSGSSSSNLRGSFNSRNSRHSNKSSFGGSMI